MNGSRVAVLIAAGLLLMLALGVGLTTVNAGPNDSDPVNCGSVIAPSDDDAEERDRYRSSLRDEGGNVEACDSARGDRAPIAYGALGLAVVAGLFSFVVPGKPD